MSQQGLAAAPALCFQASEVCTPSECLGYSSDMEQIPKTVLVMSVSIYLIKLSFVCFSS